MIKVYPIVLSLIPVFLLSACSIERNDTLNTFSNSANKVKQVDPISYKQCMYACSGHSAVPVFSNANSCGYSRGDYISAGICAQREAVQSMPSYDEQVCKAQCVQ